MTQDNRTPKQIEWERILSQHEIEAALFRARRLGILLNKTAEPDGPGAPGCWLGGDPTLPPEIDWPHTEAPSTEWGVAPLQFMAQINLAHLPRLASHAEMPRSGTLFFFFSSLFEWGAYARGKVIFAPGEVSHHPARKRPIKPAPEEAKGDEAFVRRWIDDMEEVYTRRNIDFLIYEGFKNHNEGNRACVSAIERANIDVSEHLDLITDDRRPGAELGLQYCIAHNMLGTLGGLDLDMIPRHPEWFESLELPIEDDYVRLLSITDDHQTGFRLNGWLTYYLRSADFKAGRFEEASTTTEHY